MTTQPPIRPRCAEGLASLRVGRIMREGLVSCDAGEDVRAVARTMARHGIHSVVVNGIARRDHAGTPLEWGIVSSLDLVRGLLPAPTDRLAGELAATGIATVWPSDSVADAARLMAELDVAHLVVVAPETGRPLGMLSTLDVARAVECS